MPAATSASGSRAEKEVPQPPPDELDGAVSDPPSRPASHTSSRPRSNQSGSRSGRLPPLPPPLPGDSELPSVISGTSGHSEKGISMKSLVEGAADRKKAATSTAVAEGERPASGGSHPSLPSKGHSDTSHLQEGTVHGPKKAARALPFDSREEGSRPPSPSQTPLEKIDTATLRSKLGLPEQRMDDVDVQGPDQEPRSRALASLKDQLCAMKGECPNGHTLVITKLGGGNCDGCGRYIEADEEIFECDPCDWFLCKSCAPPPPRVPGEREEQVAVVKKRSPTSRLPWIGTCRCSVRPSPPSRWRRWPNSKLGRWRTARTPWMSCLRSPDGPSRSSCRLKWFALTACSGRPCAAAPHGSDFSCSWACAVRIQIRVGGRQAWSAAIFSSWPKVGKGRSRWAPGLLPPRLLLPDYRLPDYCLPGFCLPDYCLPD